MFHDGRLYVPVASGEETGGAPSDYQCCRFRGSVVALDAATGKQIWKTYTIAEEARPTKKNSAGTQLWGPSGAPIWSSPAIDVRRNALYATTGDNYSAPATNMSDSFVAMDLKTGKLLWSRQMTAATPGTPPAVCRTRPTAPNADAPDFDFASPPILVTLANGRRALVAGQKSGMVHAVDPDREGKILWQERVGKGGTIGGVQWGSAADKSNVYVALSDIGRIDIPDSLGDRAGPKRRRRYVRVSSRYRRAGLAHAARRRAARENAAARRNRRRSARFPAWCFRDRLTATCAPTPPPTARSSGTSTRRTYETVNDVPGRGGSFDGPVRRSAAACCFVNSGYARGGMPGNVLLAFSVDGK